MALPMKKTMKAPPKGMKAMKAAMKGMKAMKARAASKIARGKRGRAAVFRGTKVKTSGGLTKDSLIKNRRGKIVSKAASAAAKKKLSAGFKAYIEAARKARKELGITGFCAVNGKTAQGKALYAKKLPAGFK